MNTTISVPFTGLWLCGALTPFTEIVYTLYRIYDKNRGALLAHNASVMFLLRMSLNCLSDQVVSFMFITNKERSMTTVPNLSVLSVAMLFQKKNELNIWFLDNSDDVPEVSFQIPYLRMYNIDTRLH